MFGRRKPWEVWGPSADDPRLGTAAAIQGLRQVRPRGGSKEKEAMSRRGGCGPRGVRCGGLP
jgi:hypothetical protein